MKLAIPVEKESEKSCVSLSFARSPYLLVYDTASQELAWIANGAAKAQGGAGIKAAQLMLDHGVEAVLLPQCGTNAASVLMGAGVSLYRTLHATAIENIQAYLRGELPPLHEIHAGFHRHGGS